MIFSAISKLAIYLTKIVDQLEKFKHKTKESIREVEKKFAKDKEKVEEKKREDNKKRILGIIRRKILLVFLRILDVILSIIDKVIIFVITHLVLVLAIVLVVLIIILVMMPWLTDYFKETTDPINNYAQTVITEPENPGSGGSAERKTAWSEYELKVRGTQLTNQQKNIYRLIMLFKDYAETSKYHLDVHYTFAMGVSESGFKFYSGQAVNTENILETPITEYISGYLKGGSKNNGAGFGGLFGQDLAGLALSRVPEGGGARVFVEYDINKEEYKPSKGLDYLTEEDRNILKAYGRTEDDLMVDAFAPYSIQKTAQVCESYLDYDNTDRFTKLIDECLDAVGLAKTDENKKMLKEMGSVRRSLDWTSKYEEPCYYFSAMVMKCAENEDGTVELTNWGTSYKYEPDMRPMVVGKLPQGVTKLASVNDLLAPDVTFRLKGVEIHCTMWQHFKKKWGNESWFITAEKQFLTDYNTYLQDTKTYWNYLQYTNIYHFAIVRYLGAENIIAEIVSNLTGEIIDGGQGYGVDEKLTLDTFAFPLIDYRGLTQAQSGLLCSVFMGYNTYQYLDAETPCRFHKGTDMYIAGKGDGEVRIASCGEGVVTVCEYNVYRGNTVEIEHPNGWTSVYMHLHELDENIKVDMKVTENTIIGTMGNTGIYSSGTHLHWQLQRPSTLPDVTQYLNPNVVNRELAAIKTTTDGYGTLKDKNDWVAAGLAESDFRVSADAKDVIWLVNSG